MYSFFPCRPYEANSRGFPRPKVHLDQVVNPKMCTGVKYSSDLDLDAMKSLWDKAVEQVNEEHLEVGVYAKMPQRV